MDKGSKKVLEENKQHLEYLISEYSKSFEATADQRELLKITLEVTSNIFSQPTPKKKMELIERLRVGYGAAISGAMDAYTKLNNNPLPKRDIEVDHFLGAIRGAPTLREQQAFEITGMLIVALSLRDRIEAIRASLIAKDGVKMLTPTLRQIALYERFLLLTGQGPGITRQNAVSALSTWGIMDSSSKKLYDRFTETKEQHQRVSHRFAIRDLRKARQMLDKNEGAKALIDKELILSERD